MISRRKFLELSTIAGVSGMKELQKQQFLTGSLDIGC